MAHDYGVGGVLHQIQKARGKYPCLYLAVGAHALGAAPEEGVAVVVLYRYLIAAPSLGYVKGGLCDLFAFKQSVPPSAYAYGQGKGIAVGYGYLVSLLDDGLEFLLLQLVYLFLADDGKVLVGDALADNASVAFHKVLDELVYEHGYVPLVGILAVKGILYIVDHNEHYTAAALAEFLPQLRKLRYVLKVQQCKLRKGGVVLRLLCRGHCPDTVVPRVVLHHCIHL